MPHTRRIDPFLLVVTDRDQGTFTIEGPMVDDTPWNDAVILAQKAGREVHCHTPGPGSVERVAAEIEQQLSLRRVPAGSIVSPFPERR